MNRYTLTVIADFAEPLTEGQIAFVRALLGEHESAEGLPAARVVNVSLERSSPMPGKAPEQMPPHVRYDECDEVGCTTGHAPETKDYVEQDEGAEAGAGNAEGDGLELQRVSAPRERAHYGGGVADPHHAPQVSEGRERAGQEAPPLDGSTPTGDSVRLERGPEGRSWTPVGCPGGVFPSQCKEPTAFRPVGPHPGVEARFCTTCDARFETRAMERPYTIDVGGFAPGGEMPRPHSVEVSTDSSSPALDGPLAALPLPAPGSAVGVINDQLGIDGAITHKGDQLKCYTRDLEEGGVSKTYLGAAECHVLARAFAALAAEFTRFEHPEKKA